MKKAKEVATRSEKTSVRENSFGSAPPDIAIQGGMMHTFGHKTRAGVWPMPTATVDSKTGYPKDHMGKSGAIVPK